MSTGTSNLADSVRAYLEAMERRELELAQTFLHGDFAMVFPGDVTFTRLDELVSWARQRYISVGKNIEGIDVCNNDVVYCYGSLHGIWLDDSRFSGIRFIDRFVFDIGLIHRQWVWNDLGEARSTTS